MVKSATMAETQESSIKFLPISSSENRDSFFSDTEAFEGDEEFYEEIEAPKFVDFTSPDHFCPDDRYWFCHRVGCDQKHEEEMDSEAIYKKFVLRVMAARSPNIIRLRKILDRNASRKCPLSAPPKPSKPRLSNMAIISSFPKKTADDKEKVVRPVPKPRSTPVTKSKPVAAKYLTTPRNKKCTQNENAFRSVQNPKPINTELPKNRMVAKALVFHSPKKKIVKVKTSVELRTPVSKLCQGMNKLDITSKPPKSSSKSYSGREISSCKVQRQPEETLSKSGKSIKSKINGKLSQQKALMKEENQIIKLEEFELQNPTHEEKCLEQEVGDNSRSQATTNGQENNSSSNGKENVNNLSEGERDENEFMEGDDDINKENAAAIDENSIKGENPKQNGRKVLAMNDQSGYVRKKVTQAQDRNLKDGLISCSSTAVKLTKPKATNPKPFRLRTDERGILKETKLERRTNHVAPQNESPTVSSTLLLSGKPQTKKQENDNIIQGGLKIPKGAGKLKPAPVAVTPESKKHSDRNAMQRLEKFRKISSPLQKHSIRPQGHVSTKKELTPFLIPGQKLDVIHENSPEVLELKRAGKTNADAADCAASRSSSHGRRPITVATHAPRA